MTIGIGVTTLNRTRVLAETLNSIKQFRPDDAVVVVVDDGSLNPARVPDWATVVRHDRPRGIPAAKNRCLAELYTRGADHIFLLDDDTRPAQEGWWKPYVDSHEPHLQYCWTHFTNGTAVPKMDLVYTDTALTGYAWSMGCMLYVERRVLDRVGGMDWRFGQGMEEHCEWSQRIHNAGFTTFVHQDVTGSKGLFYASDEHCSVQRSFTYTDRVKLLEANTRLRDELRDSTHYVEFRTPRDVVLASYFTSGVDIQRGNRKLSNDPAVLKPLIASIRTKLVVLHDCFDSLPVENHRVPSPLPAYQQRWISEWQYLRDHPEVRYVFVVDATDVKLLRDPFPHMQPDTLYTGWEPTVVGCQWMRTHGAVHAEWIDANRHRTLLNCGVAGGDRATVMHLLQRMNDLYAAHSKADPLAEMTRFNIAAYEHPHLVTGPQVTTTFKANSDNGVAWWQHR